MLSQHKKMCAEEKIAQLPVENVNAFLIAIQALFEETVEINPYEDVAFVWKSTIKAEYNSRRIAYSKLLMQFMDEMVFYADYDVVMKTFSKRALADFIKNGNSKKKAYIRLYYADEIKWYCATLINSPHSEDSVIVFIQEKDEEYKNFLIQKSMNASYEVILGIQVLTGYYNIYKPQEPHRDQSALLDYEGWLITKIYQYVKVDMIDDMIYKMSLSNVKKELERRAEYIVYCTLEMHQKTCYKKYRYAYLDESKEVILMSRIDVTEEIENERLKNATLRKALQKAEEASRIKSDFMSKMSHDMRTPLNSILGLSMLASANIDNKECVLESLNDIMMSGKHLLSMINDLLDAQQWNAEKIESEERTFSLEELVSEIKSITEPLIKEHHHNFSVKSDDIWHDRVIGNSKSICRIAVNLLTNAIKYTPDHGNIFFELKEVTPCQEKKLEYVMNIQDNGIGISAEYLKHIFEPFSREQTVLSGNVSGSGLGMSIVKNLVEQLNGTIEIQSEVCKGTKITVTFSLRKPCDTQEAEWNGDGNIEIF